MVKYRTMTINEYKMNRSAFKLLYAFHQTLFGKCLVAITDTTKAVVYLGFVDGVETNALTDLQNVWPLSEISKDTGNETKRIIQKVFRLNEPLLDSVNVLLKGTSFQVNVWKSLMNIPRGKSITYQEVASIIENPKAVRAVGNAISKNRIAYIVPCHRVTSKKTDNNKYTWGTQRKQDILDYEKTFLSETL